MFLLACSEHQKNEDALQIVKDKEKPDECRQKVNIYRGEAVNRIELGKNTQQRRQRYNYSPFNSLRYLKRVLDDFGALPLAFSFCAFLTS